MNPLQKLSHEEIVQRQKELCQKPKSKFCAVLNNIRSLYNVGSIFRTADGAGLEKLWLCGITGCPPNNQIAKTALGAENVLAWEYRKDALELIRALKAQGYQIVLLEQIKQSFPFNEFAPLGPICLVLGNEISGVGEELVALCDQAIEIPMKGSKNSLNVSVAFGIMAYHVANQLTRQS